MTGKQAVCQKYIFKIHSGRLRKARWKLTLPIGEARRNDEVISLADSQVLRWLDELNGITDAETRAREIRREIRMLRRQDDSVAGRRRVKQLYAELDELQFKQDYLCVIMDREKDYWRACRGFSVNGIKFERLLGTNGGIKNETIVFVSSRHIAEIRRRIENGRDPEMQLVPAKLEAYKALTCSASVPVSMPNGILVVNDCDTQFLSHVINLNDEMAGEPVMAEEENAQITMDASDGYGIMLPSLAQRWSEELGLDFVASGVNTRFSWEKGMVFTFDFLEFAEKVAGKTTVLDAWGTPRDIRNIELVLTTSMVKLWDSYPNCESYLKNSVENGYTFGVAKNCPKELESERNLNYQFIQSFDFTTDDIEELIAPTMEEIRDVLYADPVKASIYLKGAGLNEDNVELLENDFAKALMIEPRMVGDPYVQSRIYQLIRKRIDEAKVGVLKVHGNYSIVSGDPYALCQHIFGLPVTGLLRAGEIYNRFWSEDGADKLVCFRAPMTCHNNIRLVRPQSGEIVSYWYRYMTSCTVFNAWDTASAALNGMDFDGDLVMLTDNPVLLRRLKPLPALMCAQRKASKQIPSEQDLIASNISSFGDDIGKTTNWITSMYEVQAGFAPGSVEYETLDYRIKCGQLFQQNAIDKAKGIVCKPMPRSWHDRRAAAKIEDEDTRELYLRIVADKKPYFMRYIYPKLQKQYNTYVRNTSKNAMREFGMDIGQLTAIPVEKLTERQEEFVRYFHRGIPVGMNDCVMNRICRRFEEEFDGFIGQKHEAERFDYHILKCGVEYSERQLDAVRRLYDDYLRHLRSYAIFAGYERVDDEESVGRLSAMREEFLRGCTEICPDRRALCDIVIDICYRRSNTKSFAWDMCGDEIIENLLNEHEGRISYPVLDSQGDITFGGLRFSLKEKVLEGWNEHYHE